MGQGQSWGRPCNAIVYSAVSHSRKTQLRDSQALPRERRGALLSTGIQSTSPKVSTKQDQELVKGLGLTSATTLVMGSMIGSGVFIVAADIARLVSSPALLIAAWVVTGFMTVAAALS